MKNIGHYIAKFIALPICASIVLYVFLLILFIFPNPGKVPFIQIIMKTFILSFIVGSLGAVVFGYPLLVLIEWKFHHYRWRYVIGGALWPLLAILWSSVKSGRVDWRLLTQMPSVIVLLSVMGLVIGIFYTFIVDRFILGQKFSLLAGVEDSEPGETKTTLG